jgi:RHS repeat-associated protein
VDAVRTYCVDDTGARPWAHRDERRGPGDEAKAAGWLHYVNDPNGMPDRLVSDRGEVAFELRATPWGRAEGPGAAATPIRFDGQYHDEETGLSYNRFRYYDPELGRYLSADPLGLSGGLNGFSYADNQPTTYVDPLGLMPESTLKDPVGGKTYTGQSGFKGPLDGALQDPVNVAKKQQGTPSGGQCAEIDALNQMATDIRKQNPKASDRWIRKEMARRMQTGGATISTKGSDGAMAPCPCCAQVFFNMGIATQEQRDARKVPGVKVGDKAWDGRSAQLSQNGPTINFNPK